MSSREISDAKSGITSRKEYGFRDPVVRSVVDKFVSRSDVGYSKYGTTLDDERRLKMKGLQKYLNDIQEELMDVKIEECIASAYGEIKNRTGKMDNGTFKKD